MQAVRNSSCRTAISKATQCCVVKTRRWQQFIIFCFQIIWILWSVVIMCLWIFECMLTLMVAHTFWCNFNDVSWSNEQMEGTIILLSLDVIIGMSKVAPHRLYWANQFKSIFHCAHELQSLGLQWLRDVSVSNGLCAIWMQRFHQLQMCNLKQHYHSINWPQTCTRSERPAIIAIIVYVCVDNDYAPHFIVFSITNITYTIFIQLIASSHGSSHFW